MPAGRPAKGPDEKRTNRSVRLHPNAWNGLEFLAVAWNMSQPAVLEKLIQQAQDLEFAAGGGLPALDAPYVE